MNTKSLTVFAITLVTGLVLATVLFRALDTDTNNQVSDTDTVSSPDTDIQSEESDPATSTPITERCPTITLECLSSQPEWNPTLEAEGIERIDPGELTILNDAIILPTQIEGISMMQQTFRSGNEYCDFSGKHSFILESVRYMAACSEFGPEKYIEFAYVNTVTEEILHAYKSIDTHSFLLGTSQGPGSELYIYNLSRCHDDGVYIYSYPWTSYGLNAKPDSNRESNYHCIHPFTGEITDNPAIPECILLRKGRDDNKICIENNAETLFKDSSLYQSSPQ